MPATATPDTAPTESTAPPADAPDPNPIIAGYQIGAEMGRGPLGKIYRAVKVATGEKVVFRGFTRPDDADPEKWTAAKNQFRDLLEKHRSIDKHIVIQDILDFGEDETGLFWIATEYFEGRTLQQIMASSGQQQLPWCLEVMKQVADAVDFAGDHGLAHTDLTPYNILLVNHPESPDMVDVRVINFGLAHARSKYGSRYAAPEQQDGSEGDRRSDVYAVGALLLELLTGKPIFTGANPAEIAQKIQTEDPMKALVGRPAYIQNVIGAMLVKSPRYRYPNVMQAIDDLANKQSPAGSDRYDTVDMRTDEALAERKLERKQGDTAQDELRGAFNEADEQERFRRLELGTETAAIAGPKPAAGRSVNHISLQDYRLSEMDVLEIRWNAEREKQRIESEKEFSRNRWLPLTRWAILVGVVALLVAHAGSLPASYSEMEVVQVKGTATRQSNSPKIKSTGDTAQPVALSPKEKIRAEDLPVYISTGDDGAITFSLANGEAVYIPANSAVEIRELGYNGGPIRRFTLWGGRIAARTEAALRGKEIFEMATADGVTSSASGQTRYNIMAGSYSGARYVIATARKGPVNVGYQGDTTKLPDSKQVMIRIGGGVTPPSAIPAATQKILGEDEKALEAAPKPASFARLVSAVEETTIMPVADVAHSIASIPASMNDGKSLAVASGSMMALCALMNTAEGESGGAPDNIDLKTLSPLSLPEADRKRIMNNFEGGRLYSYRPLPNGGYEMLARANDTKHTWIRGKNGAATAAGTGPQPNP